MTMAWSSNKASFREHREYMREFRRSHADVAMVNAPRYGEPAVLERTRPLPISRSMMETGGSKPFNGTADWSVLVPVPKVAQYKLSPN